MTISSAGKSILPTRARTVAAVRIAAATALSFLALSAASDLESSLYPVAKTVSIDVVYRSADLVCWDQHVNVYRDAEVVATSWFAFDVSEGDSAAVDVSPYDPATRLPAERRHVASRDKIAARQCVDVPTRLSGSDRVLTFSGKIEYAVSHKLWNVYRYIGPFTVRAANQVIDFPRAVVAPSPQQFRLHGTPAFGGARPLVGLE